MGDSNWQRMLKSQHDDLEKMEALDAELNDVKIAEDIEKALKKTKLPSSYSSNGSHRQAQHSVAGTYSNDIMAMCEIHFFYFCNNSTAISFEIIFCLKLVHCNQLLTMKKTRSTITGAVHHHRFLHLVHHLHQQPALGKLAGK